MLAALIATQALSQASNAAISAPLPGSAPGGDAAPILVEVDNVRNDRGVVRVSICPKARFLADSCPWTANAPAHAGTTRVLIEHLPPGDYAAQVFHDENANDEVDRGIFGIPKEGVGFSRDARIGLGPPKWRDATFSHGAQAQTIRLALRYFMGPSGPEEWQQRHPRH